MEIDQIIEGDINIEGIIGQGEDEIKSELNISDVIEVIRNTDPTTANGMFPANAIGGGGSAGIGAAVTGIPSQYQTTGFTENDMAQSQLQQQPLLQNDSRSIRKKAMVKIVEQPAGKALRFRYECEGRSAGSIPGIHSTPENKTFPTIEIVGYDGPAVVVVSCVTKDPPYRPHPHNLVGKDGCKKGVCTIEIKRETMRAVFSNLGIQCVKKKDIESALRAREDIRVDPFKTGFAHKNQPSSIDLNSVRLCFQVFLDHEKKGRFTLPLTPVVSDPIYDKKAMCDLLISRLCSCSSTVAGGKEIILLCEKVAKEDISVRFFEELDGQITWEAYGDFQHSDVHKQTAISFKTPKYRTLHIEQPVKVNIQLKRPSDGATSEALPFDYLPLDSGRRTFWSVCRNLKSKPDMSLIQRILSEDSTTTEQTITTTTKSSPSENGFCAGGISSVIDEETSNDIIDLDTPVSDEPKAINIATDISSNGAIAIDSFTNSTIKKQSECEVDDIVNEIVKEMEMDIEQNITPQLSNDKTSEWIKSSEFERTDSLLSNPGITSSGPLLLTTEEDNTLNDLLNQVAELDDIYTEHILKRNDFPNTIVNELAGLDNCLPKSEQMDIDFDDAATYTSLQKAFKNPIDIYMPPTPPASHPEDDNHYDPIEVIINPPGPIIELNGSGTNLKRDNQKQEVLPPLPPKRVKRQDENRPLSANAVQHPMMMNSLERKSRSQNSTPVNQARPQNLNQFIIMRTPDQSPPSKRLPPPPPSEAKQKKPGFFSKLFSRRKSKPDFISVNSDSLTASPVPSSPQSIKTSPDPSREPSMQHFSLNDPNRSSLRSLKSLQPVSPAGKKTGKPVGRSVSSVSGKRPHLTADVIHIPLKGDSFNSLPMNEQYSNASTLTLNNLDRKTVSALQLADIPILDGNMELIAIADRQSLRNLVDGQYGVQLDPSVDLTEAEHYALYTSVAPHATASEFDETSCYYAPVDAGEILTPDEVAKRLQEINK